MKAGWFCLAILYLSVFSLAAGAEEAESVRKERCPVCGMFVAMFADWNARIVFKDSTEAIFDGAKDMFKYYLEMKRYGSARTKSDVTAISVKDYYSKEPIDARKAFFVIWSDTYGPMGHEPIPFAREGEAKQFLKEHKGKKILMFKDVTVKLLWSLDNP